MSDGMERISDGDLCLVAHNANPLDGQGGIDYLRVVRAVRAAIEGPLLADLARAHRALARAGYTDAGGVEWAAPEPAPIASSAREDIANLQAAQEATRAHNVGPFGEDLREQQIARYHEVYIALVRQGVDGAHRYAVKAAAAYPRQMDELNAALKGGE